MKKQLFLTVLLYVLHLSAASGQTPTQEQYDAKKADCDSDFDFRNAVGASSDAAIKKLAIEYGAKYYACMIELQKLEEKMSKGKVVPQKVQPKSGKPAELLIQLAPALPAEKPAPVVPEKIPEKPVLVEVRPENSRPITLRNAFDDEMQRLTWEDPGWRQSSVDADACGVLVRVHLSCSFNTLKVVSVFLSLYGKGLFPSGIGSNPLDGFTGTQEQITYLLKVIEYNRGVFTWGELTANDVLYKWQTLPPATKAPKRVKR